MKNYTFLTNEQCSKEYEDSQNLEMIKKGWRVAEITDFSMLLGGNSHIIKRKDDSTLNSGVYWTGTRNNSFVKAIGKLYGEEMGSVMEANITCRDIGGRPVLPFSSIDEFYETIGSDKHEEDDVFEVEYGFYPQSAASNVLQKKLEFLFRNDRLNTTGNSYTTDSIRDDTDKKFQPQTHIEYEWMGKRYIRVKVDFHEKNKELYLSNGSRYTNGNNVWVEVEPIKWLACEKDKVMMTRKIVFAGVQFDHEKDSMTEDFERTDMKRFINVCWAKDIEQVRSKRKSYGR